MQDRIQVNGIWYVREEERQIEVFEYKCLMYENEKFVFEASIDEETNRLDLIEVTNKQVKPWKEKTWDSLGFFRGCLERHPDSMLSLRTEEGFSDDDFETFIAFLKEIQKRGYL